MNPADHFPLLAGPYRIPDLHPSDRAFCLLRDTDVVITSWTDARLPWPRCWAVGSRGGCGCWSIKNWPER